MTWEKISDTKSRLVDESGRVVGTILTPAPCGLHPEEAFYAYAVNAESATPRIIGEYVDETTAKAAVELFVTHVRHAHCGLPQDD